MIEADHGELILKGILEMNHDYVLLVEKERMWAEMLEQVLKDHGILCVATPVFGAAMAVKAGVRERHHILVPKEQLAAAQELMNELFSNAELPVAPEDAEAQEEG